MLWISADRGEAVVVEYHYHYHFWCARRYYAVWVSKVREQCDPANAIFQNMTVVVHPFAWYTN